MEAVTHRIFLSNDSYWQLLSSAIPSFQPVMAQRLQHHLSAKGLSHRQLFCNKKLAVAGTAIWWDAVVFVGFWIWDHGSIYDILARLPRSNWKLTKNLGEILASFLKIPPMSGWVFGHQESWPIIGQQDLGDVTRQKSVKILAEFLVKILQGKLSKIMKYGISRN